MPFQHKWGSFPADRRAITSLRREVTASEPEAEKNDTARVQVLHPERKREPVESDYSKRLRLKRRRRSVSE